MTRYRVGIVRPDSNVALFTVLCQGCLDGLELGEARILRQAGIALGCEFCTDEVRRAVTEG
jgi:hypothetical protein